MKTAALKHNFQLLIRPDGCEDNLGPDLITQQLKRSRPIEKTAVGLTVDLLAVQQGEHGTFRLTEITRQVVLSGLSRGHETVVLPLR